MNTDYEYKGLWWFADKPDQKFYGTLSRQVGGRITLELITEQQRSFYESTIEVIYGVTTASEEFALLNCQRGGGRAFSRFLQTLTFDVEIALLGVSSIENASPIQGIQFNEMTFGFSGLECWLEDDAMFILPEIETKDEKTTIEIEYIYEKTDALVIKPIESTITFGYWVCRSEGGSGPLTAMEIALEIRGFFKITPATPQTLEWFFLQIQKIRNFLSLCMRQPLSIKNVAGILTKATTTFPDFPVTVYFSNQRNYDHTQFKETMLFAYEHLSAEFKEIFVNWFEKAERLKEFVTLALGVLYGAHRLSDFRFLVLMQALEGYHKMDHPEELKLEKRLQELRDRCIKYNISLTPFIFFADDRRLSELVNTRNYLSHRKLKAGKPRLEGERLHQAVGSLVSWVNILIFIELGLSNKVSLPDALRRGLLGDRTSMW